MPVRDGEGTRSHIGPVLRPRTALPAGERQRGARTPSSLLPSSLSLLSQLLGPKCPRTPTLLFRTLSEDFSGEAVELAPSKRCSLPSDQDGRGVALQPEHSTVAEAGSFQRHEKNAAASEQPSVAGFGGRSSPRPGRGLDPKAGRAGSEGSQMYCLLPDGSVRGGESASALSVVSRCADVSSFVTVASCDKVSAPESAPTAGAMPGMEKSLAHTLGLMLMDIALVACSEERRSFAIAMWLAFFNQATASTAIINFAPSLLVAEGGGAVISGESAVLLSTAVSVTKTLGVLIGLFLVDRLGRRPMLIWGAAGSAGSMVLLTLAALTCPSSPLPLLAAMCSFILAFSITWAGLFWVVTSEIFSMGAKSPAASAATALLFLTGAVTNLVFMPLVDAAGPYAFLVFAGVAALSGLFVWRWVPETKGLTLSDIQEMMAVPDG